MKKYIDQVEKRSDKVRRTFDPSRIVGDHRVTGHSSARGLGRKRDEEGIVGFGRCLWDFGLAETRVSHREIECNVHLERTHTRELSGMRENIDRSNIVSNRCRDILIS
ncbi:hypothetical protein PV326_006195 [Microctonus aethiopoides]|nr:hypothetical protein PV326_006195 [Microctonus aethiopoides]